ncbi:MAG TPA: molybdopterin-dependent oxidoreductase [Acidobacteriota bacterium]|nr:molybdopterin-dependent oxidoreductase [Acidobacteriota bacterium]
MALRGPGLVSEVESVCGLCPGACGLTVRLVDGLPVGLKGNPNHPLNRGGLCPVGLAGLDILYAPNRLRHPLRKHAQGEFRQVEWEEALGEISEKLKGIGTAENRGSAAMICGEPSSLFQDLAAQFMGWLGSPHLACTGQGNVLPFTLTQGLREVPAFDWSGADLVLSLGLDLFEDGPAPLHAASALIGARQTQDRARLLHAGSRCSLSASKADQFVAIHPGTHGALALGIAHVLVREGRYDSRFVTAHTYGFEDGRQDGEERLGFRRLLLERYYPDRVAQICGCPAAAIVRLARRFAQASRPLAIAGGEAAEGSNATCNIMAAHSLNALMGSFDKAGGVLNKPSIPLSPLPRVGGCDGEPSLFESAQGGGLLGTDPLEALSQAVSDGSPRLEVLFVIGDDPVGSRPGGSRVVQALRGIPTVIALTPFLDETCDEADWVLPTPVPLEQWEDATTPPFSALAVLGISRPVTGPLHSSRHAGDVLLDLSSRVAPEGASLPWGHYSDYLKDRLEGLSESGQGALISGSFEESWRRFLEDRGWRFRQHQGMDDFWSGILKQSGWWSPARPQGEGGQLFDTPSGRYEFFSQKLYRELLDRWGGLASSADAQQALGRARESLGLQGQVDELCLPHHEPPHLVGRGDLTLVPFRPITARGRLGTASAMVMEMFGHSVLSGWQPWAELSPETARRLDLEEGDLIGLQTISGQIEAEVRIRPGAASEAVHLPLGLGRIQAPGAETLKANPLNIVLDSRDPLSGALSLSSTRVQVRLVRRRPHGGPPPHLSGGEA